MTNRSRPSSKAEPAAVRQARQKRGSRAEGIAAAFLMLKGYRILALRYRCGVGEIDIVAQRRKRLVFVEVKARRTIADCEMSLTPQARQRVHAAARLWIARHRGHETCQLGFDTIFVRPFRFPLHRRDVL